MADNSPSFPDAGCAPADDVVSDCVIGVPSAGEGPASAATVAPSEVSGDFVSSNNAGNAGETAEADDAPSFSENFNSAPIADEGPASVVASEASGDFSFSKNFHFTLLGSRCTGVAVGVTSSSDAESSRLRLPSTTAGV